jgi:hypothetical protein
MCAQLFVIGAGLGLLVSPLTSTLLGGVEKSHLETFGLFSFDIASFPARA